MIEFSEFHDFPPNLFILFCRVTDAESLLTLRLAFHANIV